MNILLITGNHRRHLAFCEAVYNAGIGRVVAHVIRDREEMIPDPPEDIAEDLKELWRKHFRLRDEAEFRYFHFKPDIIGRVPFVLVKDGPELNSQKVIDFISSFKVDIALIGGVPIIKDPLFSFLTPYKINIHLGLIPDYKGSVTMFWPFYFLEPTMAGCTFHFINHKVDTGCILHQVTPRLERGDGMHDVASKSLLAATNDLDIVLKEVNRMIRNNVTPKPDRKLETSGKLFKKEDFTAEKLRINYQLYNDDLVDRYLNGQLRCRKPELIQLSRG